MTTVPRYLALDMGTATGYALAEGDRIVKCGVRDFSIRRNQHIGNRGIMFYNFLNSLGRIDEIYYEKIMFTGKFNCNDGHELYHGLLMVMNMVAAGYAIPTIGVWPGTLKKAFTGNGAAQKEEMCAEAHRRGWKGGKPGTREGHDEVDAIALIITQLRERYNIHARF